MFQRLKTKSKGLLFYNEGDETTGGEAAVDLI